MKETFSGAELRSHAQDGFPRGRRHPREVSPEAVQTVTRLLDEARRYGLCGVDVLAGMSIEQLAADYNGIGPANFPPAIRQAIDTLVPDLRCVALIHDIRWAHSDGSVAQFNASNMEFEKNGTTVACARYKWHPLRRIRLKSVARVFADLCSSNAGWNAYLAARR